MLREIRPDDARIGMYVHRFGGSWFTHPFWRGRFLIETADDLERIRQSDIPCLLIDDARGIAPPAPPPAAAPPPRPVAPRAVVAPVQQGTKWSEATEQRVETDRQAARALVARSKTVMRGLFAEARLGRAVRTSDVAMVVDGVVETVDHNPRALMEVLRLKKKNEYTYLHSVSVCTLMVNAARHLGKGLGETRDYGLAGLLHDIGKMGVADDILDKDGRLTEAEFAEIRGHPAFGHRLLSQTPDMPAMVLDVCLHHHEKMDGRGYPFGLGGDAISPVARMSAICDVYDALTSERAYKASWSPVEALTAMWSWEGHFDRALLFAFMQSVAIFPPGLPVRLRSNRLALTLENRRRNSRPRVLAFLSTRDRAPIALEEIVIQDNLANDSIVGIVEPAEWGLSDWDAMVERLKRGEPLPLAA